MTACSFAVSAHVCWNWAVRAVRTAIPLFILGHTLSMCRSLDMRRLGSIRRLCRALYNDSPGPRSRSCARFSLVSGAIHSPGIMVPVQHDNRPPYPCSDLLIGEPNLTEQSHLGVNDVSDRVHCRLRRNV